MKGEFFLPAADTDSVCHVGILVPQDFDPVFLHPFIKILQQAPFISIERVLWCKGVSTKKMSLSEMVLGWVDRMRNRRRIHRLSCEIENILTTIPCSVVDQADCEKIRAHAREVDLFIDCTTQGVSIERSAAIGEGIGFRKVATEKVSQYELFYYPYGRSEIQGPVAVCGFVGRAGGLRISQLEGYVSALLTWWELFKNSKFQSRAQQASGATNPLKNELSAGTFRTLRRKFSQFRQRTTTKEWQIGLRAAVSHNPLDKSLEGFRWVDAPKGSYLADPFLFEQGDNTWLFAEEYVYARGRGRISCAEIRSDGSLREWQPVLDMPYHLSFPHIFQYDGDVYMIPESAEDFSVSLYRAEEFPNRWYKVAELWNGPGLDTVVHRQENTWYFFTSIQQQSALPPQLLLFTADDLFAPWQLHESSPLHINVRYGRNAGRLFNEWKTGHVIRPSQDGLGGYGSRLNFHSVSELDKRNYAEHLERTLLPPDGFSGIHHFDRSSRWEVIDSCREIVTSNRFDS